MKRREEGTEDQELVGRDSKRGVGKWKQRRKRDGRVPRGEGPSWDRDYTRQHDAGREESDGGLEGALLGTG